MLGLLHTLTHIGSCTREGAISGAQKKSLTSKFLLRHEVKYLSLRNNIYKDRVGENGDLSLLIILVVLTSYVNIGTNSELFIKIFNLSLFFRSYFKSNYMY